MRAGEQRRQRVEGGGVVKAEREREREKVEVFTVS